MLQLVDESGRFLSVNEAWLAKLGYAREEVIGRQFSDFLTVECRPRAMRRGMPEFFRFDGSDNAPYQMLGKGGEVIDVLFAAVVDESPEGRGLVSIAVVTDVTARDATGRRLRENEAGRHSLGQDRTELVSLVTPEGELHYVNDAYASFYRARTDEMIGRSLFELAPPESRSALTDHLRHVCETRASVDFESKVTLFNGETGWLAFTNRALRDAQGRVTTIYSIGRGVGHSASSSCNIRDGFDRAKTSAPRTSETSHPGDAETILEILSAESSQSTVIYRMQREDGGYVWVESGTPVEIDGRSDCRLSIVHDTGAPVETEPHVQGGQARYRFFAENSTDLIILVGHDGRRQYVSPACRALLGYEPEEMLTIPASDMIHPEDRDRALDVLVSRPVDGARGDQTSTCRMRRKDGRYIWVETTGRVFEIAGLRDQRLVVVRDVDRRMIAEQRLKASEAQYRLLADHSTDIVVQLDGNLVNRYVSPACRDILGFEPEELVGTSQIATVHPEDGARFVLMFQSLLSGRVDRQTIVNRVQHRDKRWIWVEAQFRALKDAETGELTGIIGALRDISARKEIEDNLAAANERLRTLADKDSLTGLPNRRVFDEALVREHRRATVENRCLSLIMIDVDRFKSFNDLYGHPAGDDCLKRVGAAIAASVYRPADVVCRYGGEEFAILLPQTDESSAATIAERVRQAVARLGIEHGAHGPGVVTISAGVACTSPPAYELEHSAFGITHILSS